MRVLMFLLLLSVPLTGFALSEADVVERTCNGIVEYPLADRTRVDCLTDTFAMEYDWCSKWAEAVGQSLWYAANTGLRAKVMLIQKPDKPCPGIIRLNKVIAHYGLPITVELVALE